MMKIILAVIFIFLIIGIIISASMFSNGYNEKLANLMVAGKEEPEVYSIKEIETITAESNLHFTIVNTLN